MHRLMGERGEGPIYSRQASPFNKLRELQASTGLLDSDSDTRNSNRLLLQYNSLSGAREIWELGKELMVTYEGVDEAIIKVCRDGKQRQSWIFIRWGNRRFLMQLCLINIKGLGAVIKKKKICYLVTLHNLEFLVIQETKIKVIDADLCQLLWGSTIFNWSFLPAQGSSRGLLNIWTSRILTSIFSFVGEGYSGVCFERGKSRILCFIINIYSPFNLA